MCNITSVPTTGGRSLLTNHLGAVMKFKITRILSILLITFSLLFDGCTIYGLGIGAIVDLRKPDKGIVNREEYMNIEIYRDITIYQNDRTVTKGRFIGINEEYLTLETNFGIENVNMSNIVMIEAKSKKNAMMMGLGIGIALDVAYIYWLSQPGNCC